MTAFCGVRRFGERKRWLYNHVMLDIDQLPIPDWGLRCLNCDAPLAGLQIHRCGACGQPFDMRYLLSMHRPIPNIGLVCQECGYLLTGLMDERCPECGTEFAVREMLEDQSALGVVDAVQLADPDDHYVKKREPALTGQERPLPELGLSCAECGSVLAGAAADVCPECGSSFDLSALVPDGDWVSVSEFVPANVPGVAKTILYGAQIPYLVDDAQLERLYGGRVRLFGGGIRVPRGFFFDALHAFAAADEPPAEYARAEWICLACNEHVPAGFEVCWNCGGPHPDEATGDQDRTES